jgi:DNA-binding FrmR family transcriptional regulator
MSHVSQDRRKLLARVRRIAGQVAALEKALQGDPDCGQVLVQIAAAKGAMHGLMLEVLAGHLSGHVVEEEDPGRRREESARVLELLKSMAR